MVHPTSLILARLKREPLADLPIANPLDQAALRLGHRWRDRTLRPQVPPQLKVTVCDLKMQNSSSQS